MGISVKSKVLRMLYRSSIMRYDGESPDQFQERKIAATERFASEPDVVKKRLVAKKKPAVPRTMGDPILQPGVGSDQNEDVLDAALGGSNEDSHLADGMMTWTPENITNTMKGMDVLPALRGLEYLMEVGESHRGWYLDFRQDKVKVTRYPITKIRSKKPPKSSSTDIPELQSLPWIWYKNRRFFTNLETGKMSLKSGIIRKKMAVSDVESIELLGLMWNAAKEKSAKARS